ncbi:MAG TPA: hypothetical protein VFV67_31170 [Actinophytocola sp.]|uniref:hypothetical protein n=1 Tax=Actinophytocola sp. TaxID=1872138 RepID=UPI002DC051FC|nr:hypothetical protein [Actinophytocola sp.]HEU5475129.1 hypothetical protein [Actinophytocola sp.]
MDREWFADLYQSSYRRVVLIAYARCGDLSAAESAARDAFARAYPRDRPEPWIQATAVRLARRRSWRARGRDADAADPVAALRQAGLPAEEIASRLDIPIGTVRTRMSGPQPDIPVPVPPVGKIIERSRQRAGRLRMQVGAAAAALVVFAVIPALRTPPPPDPGPADAEVISGLEPTRLEPEVYSVEFADRLRGYALRAVCPGEPFHCVHDLMVTEDALRWTARGLPPHPGPEAAWVLHVLGPRRVVVETRETRWHSDNAGVSWRKVPTEPVRTVPAIPPDAVLSTRCAVATRPCVEPDGVVVLLPETGHAATLANPPPLLEPNPGAVPAADGGWWVSGRDPASDGWAVAVSRDGGRTWSVGLVPEFTGVPFAGPTITTGAGVAYATFTGARRNVNNGLLAIFRSTDGGQTWEQTYQRSRLEPRSVAGVAVAAADGTLVVFTESGTQFNSADGGRTFTGGKEVLGHVEWARGGYFARHSYPSNMYFWSPNGVYWTQFLIG